MDVPLDRIGQGLSEFGGVKGRLQYKRGGHGALVIDDTYNANPASMKAAIDVLAARPEKKLLVLGDMGELGDDAASMHAEIGAYAREAGIAALFVLGELSLDTVRAFGNDGRHFTEMEALTAALLPEMDQNCAVLVKGSRFMRMERAVEAITEEERQQVADDNKRGER